MVPKSYLDTEETAVEENKQELDSVFREFAFKGSLEHNQKIKDKPVVSESLNKSQSHQVEDEMNDISYSKSEPIAEQSQETELNKSVPAEKDAQTTSIPLEKAGSRGELEKKSQPQAELTKLSSKLGLAQIQAFLPEKLQTNQETPENQMSNDPICNRFAPTQTPNLSHLFTPIPIYVPVVRITPVWSNPVIINPVNNFKDRMSQLLNYYDKGSTKATHGSDSINNHQTFQDGQNVTNLF